MSWIPFTLFECFKSQLIKNLLLWVIPTFKRSIICLWFLIKFVQELLEPRLMHCIQSNVVFFIENYFQKDLLENTIQHEIWISNFKLTILSRLLALSSPENNIWFITLFLASTQAQSDCACSVSYMAIKFKKGCHAIAQNISSVVEFQRWLVLKARFL